MKRGEIVSGRRIVVLCEGDTEEHCVKHFLRRSFESERLSALGLHPINLGARLEDVVDYTVRYRRDRRVVAVFTLVDLYGMNRVNHRLDDSLDTKVEKVKQWLWNDMTEHCRGFFHPHVSVHEIEAWFLAEGKALGRRLKCSTLRPVPHAEELDFDKPPKRRINALFRRYLKRGYEENGDGQPLFKALDHSLVYERCGYYRALYDDLVGCGRAAIASV